MTKKADEEANKEIFREAEKRFNRVSSYESESRKRFQTDLKFAEADADNGWQWPADLYASRQTQERPSLTVNKTRQHNLQIINDAKQNKPGIIFRATGGGASYESAQVLQDIVRYIEYQSNATDAYNKATEFQVKGGIGWIRLATDWAGDDTFDQDIFIRPVINPLSVYIDPDAKEMDKSDARWAFVFDDVIKKDFDEMYPDYAQYAGQSVFSVSDWLSTDKVRICEYFRCVSKVTDQLVGVTDANGNETLVKKSQLKGALLKAVTDDPLTKTRDIVENVVEYYLIVGTTIIDSETKVLPGKYIPLVPVIGEETLIEGKLDRKGHTRAMIDPQRMYNYWASSAVEFVALQGKSPWVASAQSIEEYEEMWNTANTENYSVLIYNGLDDAGQPIAPPMRPQPPMNAPAYIEGMQIAGNEMMQVSGQYAAQMGAPGNERSGKAITERQRQGDTATYHYIDNLGTAIRHVGRIILDWIPKIYDTKRIINVMAMDGTDYEVELDPRAKETYVKTQIAASKAARHVLNPTVGKYEVQADIGPSYGTKREEAFHAISLILTQAPQLTSILGDILFRMADFPMAAEAAQRLKRMVPATALGEGPSPTEQELMGQVENLKGLLAKALDEVTIGQIKLRGKEQARTTDVYEAETDRMKALKEVMPVDQAGLTALVQQLVQDALNTHMEPVLDASEPGLQAAAGQFSQQDLGLGMPPQGPAQQVGADGRPYERNLATSPSFVPVGNGGEQ